MARPQFSIITPVHNPPAAVLAEMLASVQAQTCDDWEHCIVDDGSTQPWVRSMLTAAAATDQRIKVIFRERAGGIVCASRAATEMATGTFLALLDHDDRLHEGALGWVNDEIGRLGDVDAVYTDEDKIDSDGNHYDAFLKPDWSPDRLRVQMYTGHLGVLRRSLVEKVGGFRDGFDGSQDWDLWLRVTERARRVVHVRQVAYHWRAIPGSAAAELNAKPYAAVAAVRAINEHLERVAFPGVVRDEAFGGVHSIQPKLDSMPRVSIVIPTAGSVKAVRGLPEVLVLRCIESILQRSTYANYEIVVVADNHTHPETLARLETIDTRVRVVEFAKPFNFSEKINVGALHSSGDHLLLLNDDIEVLPDGWRDLYPSLDGPSSWIERMLMYSAIEGVGAVGARLYFDDLRIQHAGVVVHGGLPSHPYRGFSRDHRGYFSNAVAVSNLLAVTAACLMTPRAAFERVGGLSLTLPVNYNDVDFCFKLHRAGLRCVYQPDVELLHYESASRVAGVHPDEIGALQARWFDLMSDDPYFHPRFFQGRADFLVPPMLADGRLVAS